MVCFLCNIEIISGDKSYCLFNKRVCEENGQVYPSLAVLLELTISHKIDPDSINSKILCDKCTNLVYMYEEIYEEYIRLKRKIIDMYNKTSKLYGTHFVSADTVIEDEPNKDIINYMANNIPQNIFEIPENEDAEQEILNVNLLTNEISNEDVLYEHIKEDKSVFYNTNSDSIKIDFPVSINLDINEINIVAQELIQDDNLSNDTNESLKHDEINTITTIPTTILSENQIELIAGKPQYEKRFSCDLCGVNFAHKKNLSTHKRTLHFNGKTYKCDECECCFSRKIHLECHIRSSHTGEKPFICNICNASFAYPHIYVRHLKIHSNIKYSCDICGKKFNSRDNRDAHSFIHSHKKRYECFDCGQGFMQKSLLKTHVQNMGHKNIIVVNQPPIKSVLNDETTTTTIIL